MAKYSSTPWMSDDWMPPVVSVKGPDGNYLSGLEIVEAVHERDRLRELVRRLADSLGVAMYALRASALFPGPPPDPPHDHLNGVDITALLDEAREAIGEHEP